MKAFLIDLARCNGCHNCQIVCKDEHVDNDWAPYAAPQPDTGQFWIKVNERVHGSTPKVRVAYTPVLCNHCAHPACAEVARDGAVYQREDGLVIIDPIKAKGQRALVDACPYGAVYWNDELDLPQKCTGCAHLLDEGWEVPRCVEACATDALQFLEEDDIRERFPDAAPLGDCGSCGPRTYYRRAKKPFVAGTLFDPACQEVIVGARATLLDEEGVFAGEALTDGFGDFWIENVDEETYALRLEAEGYEQREEHVVVTDGVNVGDLPLTRTN
ncbi:MULTISPECIES: 4Fe-4S dicluster domain-containing protein [Gordonibacter]|uniref:Carboxypeptidase regulatory-like domain-containing protein n=1 Tax=Gordonibacter faecis TaxID=3047475 RepID=A0ABT7DLC5_9ACTN|nr:MULTISPECIES: 4Fe-4S dicluster domain-containing protein [unclassified Gordonibacter]MDJ1650337.1 carboxypeptidase regulatory-like domain-containing protein [Gordonibacter sp. KGMB12511]HIW76817.1 carboxypeptidase regulatory-like domain-containing protein [Candidatus Gordonibacter avicola]